MKIRLSLSGLLLLASLGALIGCTSGEQRARATLTQIAAEVYATQTQETLERRTLPTPPPTGAQAIGPANAGLLTELARFPGHRIIALAAARDSRRVAAAEVKALSVYDLDSLTRTLHLDVPQAVEALALSPDGRLLAAAHAQTIQLWRANDGAPLQTYTLSDANLSNLLFSHDGSRLVASSWDGTLHVWDTRSGALLYVVQDDELGDALAALPGEDALATTSWLPDWIGRLDLSGGSQAGGWWLETEREGTIDSIAMSAVGGWLAACWDDGALELRRIAGSRAELWIELAAEDAYDPAFSPDGRYLAAQIYDEEQGGRIRVWRVEDGSLAQDYPGEAFTFVSGSENLALAIGGRLELRRISDGALLGTAGERSPLALDLSARGGLLALAFSDGTVEVWGDRGRSLRYTLEAGPEGWDTVTFSPDGAALLTGRRGRGVWRMWAMADGEQLYPMQDTDTIQFTPDGAAILSHQAGDSRVVLAHLGDGSPIRAFEHPVEVLSVVLSPDGERLATSIADGTVWLWRVADGTLLRTLDEDHRALGFSANGARVLTRTEDGDLVVWSAAEGTELSRPGWEAALDSWDLNPAGWSALIFLESPGQFYFWDLSKPEPLLLEDEYAGSFSPDGRFLATAGFRRATILRRAGDGALLAAIPEGGYPLGFSANGDLMLAYDFSGNVNLYATADGAPVGALTGFDIWPGLPHVAQDGTALAFPMQDGGISLWGVP